MNENTDYLSIPETEKLIYPDKILRKEPFFGNFSNLVRTMSRKLLFGEMPLSKMSTKFKSMYT